MSKTIKHLPHEGPCCLFQNQKPKPSLSLSPQRHPCVRIFCMYMPVSCDGYIIGSSPFTSCRVFQHLLFIRARSSVIVVRYMDHGRMRWISWYHRHCDVICFFLMFVMHWQHALPLLTTPPTYCPLNCSSMLVTPASTLW